MAAVSELRNDYSDRVDLQIVDPQATAGASDELETYNLKSRGHGLVALTRTGEPVYTIAGHNFGEEEIVNAIE